MMKKIFSFITVTIICALCALPYGCKKNGQLDAGQMLNSLDANTRAVASVTGTDELGRSFAPVAGFDGEKYVGMFYFPWNGQHDTNYYDVNYLLANAPEEFWSKNSSVSRANTYHYWGEPLFGFYDNSDPWVLSRHIEMFTAAGVDFLGLDLTNAVTYDKVLVPLFETLLKYQAQGFPVPKVMFLTNTNSAEVVLHLYNTYYTNEKYDSIWFSPEGKPMLAANKGFWFVNGVDHSYLQGYFDLKAINWPTGNQTPDGFPWMDFKYPQETHRKSKIMSVSVAQHNTVVMSKGYDGNRGRSFNFGLLEHNPERVAYGDNYASQWQTVLNAGGDVRYAFITGWNEWIAIKFTDRETPYMVDEFNTEFSRDLEPMRQTAEAGGYGDCYYMQTADYIRRWKGVSYKKDNKISDCGDLSDPDAEGWETAAEYADFEGDAMIRDYNGSVTEPGTSSKIRFYDASARNDIVSVKVATNKEYAFFRVQTAKDITAPDGSNWMNIMISSGESAGFNGYNYIINAQPDLAGGKTSVCRFTGVDFLNEKSAEAYLGVRGNVMIIRVKLGDIGLSPSKRSMSFKVTDGITVQDELLDYYVSGDSAPIGRLSYAYAYGR